MKLPLTAPRPPSPPSRSSRANSPSRRRTTPCANVSHAFGDYLDDFDWDNSSALFARTGRRGKYQVGFYVGPERIRTAETDAIRSPALPRTSVQIHLRTQPVIDVSNDGMTAKLRTRLFSFNASTIDTRQFPGRHVSQRQARHAGWRLEIPASVDR